MHRTAENLAWQLTRALLLLLPLVFVPVTIEVYVLPKAALLWVLVAAASCVLLVGELSSGVLRLPTGPGLRALGAFAVAAIGATILSPSPWVSLLGAFMRREGLVTLLAYVLLYVLVLRLATTRRRVEEGVWALIIPVAPTGLYAVAQAFGFEFVRELNPSGAAVRAYGWLGNADFLGIYAALLLPILAAALLNATGWRRAYVAISLFLNTLALLFSYSRGGWLGAAIGIVALLIVLGTATVRRKKWVLALAAAIVLLAATVSVALRAVQHEPPERSFARHAASIASVGTGTAATRLTIWPRTLRLVEQRPFLGFGPETFRGQFMPVRGDRIVALEGTARWDRPHNSLLYLATSTGLIGLGCYLGFLASVLVWVLRARGKSLGAFGLAYGLAAGAVAAQVAEFFVFWSPVVTPLAFVAMGLAVAHTKTSEDSDEADNVNQVRVSPPVAVGSLTVAVAAAIGVGWIGVQALRADRYADLGRAELQQGARAQATADYDKAVATAWWINDYRWRAARGWEQAGFAGADAQALARAAEILKQGLRVDPFDEQAYAQLGDVYRYMATRTGQPTVDVARTAYERALVLDPFSPRAHAGLATLLAREGDHTGALNHARKVLKFDPANRDMSYLAGSIYEKLGNRRWARFFYEKALEVDSGYQPAREGLRRVD